MPQGPRAPRAGPVHHRHAAVMSHPTDPPSLLEPHAPPRQSPPGRERPAPPAEASGAPLAAVRQAWLTARGAYDATPAAVDRAVAAYARDGRERGAPVETLLRGLDAVIGAEPGVDAEGVDPVRVRQWAGTQLIRAYYRAD